MATHPVSTHFCKLGLLACLASLSGGAWADNDFIVYSPDIVKGQSEVESYAFLNQDSRPNFNGASGLNLSIAHAFTSWWKPELYIGEFNSDPGGPTFLSGYEFENVFQLTDRGEYWADLGLLASYGYSKLPGTPDTLEFGPLLEKRTGHIDQRLNLIWGREIGTAATPGYHFRTAYSLGYALEQGIVTWIPGLEAYYRPNDDAHQIGPVLSGEIRTGHGKEIEFGFGMVYGVNPWAPQKTWLARLEYEFL